MACNCLWLVQELFGYWRIGHAILIANSLAPIELHNVNPFVTFSFAFLITSTRKYEVDISSSSQPACLHAMPISKFWHIILHRDVQLAGMCMLHKLCMMSLGFAALVTTHHIMSGLFAWHMIEIGLMTHSCNPILWCMTN